MNAIPWKRLWVESSSPVQVDNDGFVADPAGWLSPNEHLKTLDEIRDRRCLILLGEMGAGKSTEIRSYGSSLRAPAEQMFLDLKDASSDIYILRETFDSERFRAWRTADYLMELIFDSLDEVSLSIGSVGGLIAREIQKLSRFERDRLRLRIVSRTGSWQRTLQNRLNEAWGSDVAEAWEIVPLRRADVDIAASTLGINPVEFRRAIEGASATQFAARPITLFMLLEDFRNGHAFTDALDLFDRACRRMCVEDQQRQETGTAGLLSPGQRLLIAGRIALLMILGAKQRLTLGIPDADGASLHLDTILRGYEQVADSGEALSRSDVVEVASTALFVGYGLDSVGWVHRSVMEFLAAWYLHQKGVSERQVLELLLHPGLEEQRVVPQLEGLAAWIAAREKTVALALAKANPDALLAIPAVYPSQIRREVCRSLLEMFLNRRLNPHTFSDRQYSGLRYDEMHLDLGPLLKDRAAPIAARIEAVNLAGACRVTELTRDLVTVALDPDEEESLRTIAIQGIQAIGDPPSLREIVRLAVEPVEVDAHDRIKGSALQATWPSYLSTADVLAALTPPRKTDYIGGAYWNFLIRDLPEKLQPSDIALVLDWAMRQPAAESLAQPFPQMIDSVFAFASSHSDNSETLIALARAVYARLLLDHELGARIVDSKFLTELQDDESTRRGLIVTMLELLSPENMKEWWGLRPIRELLVSRDAGWLLGISEVAEDAVARAAAVQLVDQILDPRDVDAYDALYRAATSDAGLSQFLGPRFSAIALDSDYAARERDEYRLMTERSSNSRREALDVGEATLSALERFESGDIDAFWQLNRMMSVEGGFYRYEFGADLRRFPGWKIINDPARVLAACLIYVREANPQPDKWVTRTNYRFFPAEAGYRALRLISVNQREALESLADELFERWAPAIVMCLLGGEQENEADQRLAECALRKASAPTLQWIGNALDRSEGDGSPFQLLERLATCENPQLNHLLAQKVSSPNYKTPSIECILKYLARRVPAVVEQHAMEMLLLRNDEQHSDRVLLALSVALGEIGANIWPDVWPVIQAEPEFGEQLLSKAITSRHGSRFLQQLEPNGLADLYLWSQERSAESLYARPDGTGFLSDANTIGMWRDALPRIIADRGTFEACAALERIVNHKDSSDWIPYLLVQAEAEARKQSWQPLVPDGILRLLADSRKRYVRSTRELLDITIESLERLDAKLQGTPPASQFLWNEGKRDEGERAFSHQPKDEESLSDYVALHLQDDIGGRAVAVNREVQIRRRRGEGGRRGERADIHVDAISECPNEDLKLLRMIIEVKGCWNKGLLTDMRDQLRERYLTDSPHESGLYLVGWYECAQWQSDTAHKWTLHMAKAEFEKQASELSRPGKPIRSFVLNAALR